MQEIPIPDATFLDGDANTYPGELEKVSSKIYLSRCLIFFHGALYLSDPYRSDLEEAFSHSYSCDDRSNESNAVQLFTSNASQTHITIV